MFRVRDCDFAAKSLSALEEGDAPLTATRRDARPSVTSRASLSYTAAAHTRGQQCMWYGCHGVGALYIYLYTPLTDAAISHESARCRSGVQPRCLGPNRLNYGKMVLHFLSTSFAYNSQTEVIKCLSDHRSSCQSNCPSPTYLSFIYIRRK